MSSAYYICQLFTNVKHICRIVLWNSSKIKNYVANMKYKVVNTK